MTKGPKYGEKIVKALREGSMAQWLACFMLDEIQMNWVVHTKKERESFVTWFSRNYDKAIAYIWPPAKPSEWRETEFSVTHPRYVYGGATLYAQGHSKGSKLKRVLTMGKGVRMRYSIEHHRPPRKQKSK